MIIKIIAENDAEKQRLMQKFGSEKVVYNGVQEYLIFGSKVENNYLVDFHEWAGSYRYLMSNLNFFYEIVNDERRLSSVAPSRMAAAPANMPMVRRGNVDNPNIQAIDIRNLNQMNQINQINQRPNSPRIVEVSREEMRKIVPEDPQDQENDMDIEEERDTAPNLKPVPPTIPTMPNLAPNANNNVNNNRGLRIIPSGQK